MGTISQLSMLVRNATILAVQFVTRLVLGNIDGSTFVCDQSADQHGQNSLVIGSVTN